MNLNQLPNRPYSSNDSDRCVILTFELLQDSSEFWDPLTR